MVLKDIANQRMFFIFMFKSVKRNFFFSLLSLIYHFDKKHTMSDKTLHIHVIIMLQMIIHMTISIKYVIVWSNSICKADCFRMESARNHPMSRGCITWIFQYDKSITISLFILTVNQCTGTHLISKCSTNKVTLIVINLIIYL